jgi:hypothetical protein
VDLNISICERDPIAVPIVLINDDAYTTTRGLEVILQQWCDRPSRTWMRLGDQDTHYVVAHESTGRVEMNAVERIEDDSCNLYPLNAIDNALGMNVLTWGRAIGEPDLAAQERVLTAMRRRAEGGVPETWEALESLVLLSMGDVQ